MRKIIFTRPDGGLSIVNPVINTHPQRENITEAQAEQRAWDKLPKDAINPKFVEKSIIPLDRIFRNAWKAGQGVVEVDMPKAREIKRNQLRVLRRPLMESLDAAYMQADETGDVVEKQRIAAKKQALRDVTKNAAIEAAQTPEELMAVLPEALK